MSDISKIINTALSHGLSLRPETIRINQSGLDFLAAYAIDQENTEWVLRFPRRDDVISSAITESKALNLLRNKLPVAVPDWKIHTPELIAYPKLTGEPAATIDPEQKAYVWYIDQKNSEPGFISSLAGVLAKLHSIGSKAAVEAGLPFRSAEESRLLMAENMGKAKQVLKVPEKLWNRWQKWVNDKSFWPDFSVLIHGDFHPGHILVDEKSKVTGILDWTEAQVGDPAVDFGLFHGLFDEMFVRELLKEYEAAGGRVWPKMFEHTMETYLANPVNFVVYSLKTGNDEYLGVAQWIMDSYESE